MRLIYKHVLISKLTLAVIGFFWLPAQAHLMEAQQGTLNIIDDEAFMVLSLPISTFEDIDDNKNGAVSMVEFNDHRSTIIGFVKTRITLSDNEGNIPLEGVMLSPEVFISQLVVLGRFALVETNRPLRFHNGLYGQQEAEQVVKITATRQPDGKKYIFELTPEVSSIDLKF
jgi:hypothetical protein